MKLKFINSSKDEKEKNEKIVKMTVTKMIFKFKKLLINVIYLLMFAHSGLTPPQIGKSVSAQLIAAFSVHK